LERDKLTAMPTVFPMPLLAFVGVADVVGGEVEVDLEADPEAEPEAETLNENVNKILEYIGLRDTYAVILGKFINKTCEQDRQAAQRVKGE
jgi:hypothetical protein